MRRAELGSPHARTRRKLNASLTSPLFLTVILPLRMLTPVEARPSAGWRLIAACCVSVVAALWAMAAPAQVDIGSGLRISVPARSLKDIRDENLVRQRFDFSCGAASLATLLRYGLGEDVTEAQILQELFGLLSADQQEVARATGFSLLNLQQVAQARGFRAGGFRLTPDQIRMLSGPVIVFIEPRGYQHFAVLRGVRGDRAYLADPSRGNIRMPLYQFLDSWLQEDGSGIIFVVEPETGLPDEIMPLALSGSEHAQPEIMSIREMLNVGSVARPLAGF